MSRHPSLTRFAWISVAAAAATVALKGFAYLLTGSVGLLSDALESLVNVVAAFTALAMLTLAARPPDEDHAYGHGKAEYFSSGFEGALILVASIAIGWTAVGRLVAPRPIEQPGAGLAVAAVAAALNAAVAMVLLRAGRRHESITLEANARHLLTDVWTSGGVIVGVGAAVVTGWNWLDPVVALAVAVNILRWGVKLLRASALGLLDTALPEPERASIEGILGGFRDRGVQFHALRTRRAGVLRFVSMHVLVPGEWTVQEGHELLEELESRIRDGLPSTTVFTHLEPLEDPVSWEDTALERADPGERSGRPDMGEGTREPGSG